MAPIVAGLRLVCTLCRSETYSSPPLNTEEIREAHDVCTSCAREMNLTR